ncbi:MAG: protoheme IX farnesyltransferase [Alicyclobacillaceae bacterium]|nr:protoheme IX farnesyltransferase [Alicyclobacillaceae bacterium]
MGAEGWVLQSGAPSRERAPAEPTRRGPSLRDYVSVAKLGITFANLMATFAGLWAGSRGHPSAGTVVWTLVGTALVVAAGATLNNYVDRDIDPRMERTKTRAVAEGRVAARTALYMGLALACAGLAVLALLVNRTAAAAGLAGLVVYAYVYSVWLKRTTSLSTVFGGVAGALPPLIGWAGGSGGSLGLPAWCVFFTFFLWQPPHFLPLAMRRVDEYRAAGIPMLPVVRGFAETKRQIVAYTAAMLPVSLLLYGFGYVGRLYLWVVLVLGLWFLADAVSGFFARDDLRWAGRVFRTSLIYLTGLCAAIVAGVLR